jgi:Holliday junction resolvase
MDKEFSRMEGKKKKKEIENIMYFPAKAKAVHLVATKTAEMGYKVQNSHLRRRHP